MESSKISLAVDASLAPDLIPLLEKRKKEAEEKIKDLQLEVNEIASRIAQLQMALVDKTAFKKTETKLERRPSGRVPRGKSEEVVVDYLKNQIRALSTADIATSTGATYGTVYRILQGLLNERKVNFESGSWKWKKLP